MSDKSLLNLDAPEGNNDAPPANNQTPPPAGDKKDDQAPPPQDDKKGDKPQRPENVPEKFWDKDKGEIKVDDVLKSYGELESQFTESRKVPEKYAVNIPKEMADQVELKEDDPMLVDYLNHAKENKYTQAKVDSDLNFYLKFMQGQLSKDFKKEIEALGGKEKVKEIAKDINTWGKGVLSEKSFGFMQSLAVSKDGIEFLQELRKLNAVQDIPPEEGDDTKGDISGDLTEEKLRSMMKKEEYWNPRKRDPKFVKQVTEGFQKLYAKGQG